MKIIWKIINKNMNNIWILLKNIIRKYMLQVPLVKIILKYFSMINLIKSFLELIIIKKNIWIFNIKMVWILILMNLNLLDLVMVVDYILVKYNIYIFQHTKVLLLDLYLFQLIYHIIMKIYFIKHQYYSYYLNLK